MPGVYLLLIGICDILIYIILTNDNNVTVEQIRDAVKKEVDGSGKLLGYRAMQKTLRQEHELKVPRDLVYVVMQDVDPEGLQAKVALEIQNKSKKGNTPLKAQISFILLTDTTN